MKTKNENLPAVKEINLFTSEKNVNKEHIGLVCGHLKKAGSISIRGAGNFNVYIYKDFYGLSLDTIMYLHEQYQFSTPRVQTSYDNKIFVTSEILIRKNIRICLQSEKWDINLLPNDVKMIIGKL